MSLLLEQQGARLEVIDDGLRVSGRVDFSAAADLAAAGSGWLANQPAGSRVVVDLQGVVGVSSAALSMVLEWMRRSRVAGLELCPVRLSGPLQRLTEVAGLDRLLPVASPGD